MPEGIIALVSAMNDLNKICMTACESNADLEPLENRGIKKKRGALRELHSDSPTSAR